MCRRLYVILLASAGVSIAFTMPTSAQAQEAGSTQKELSSDDIVVTATRNETLLSKTPVTMTALTAETLRDSGIRDARSLSDAVPSIAITENDTNMRISIRGVTSTDTTEKGDPSAAFLIDGIYIARSANIKGSFFDLERIEVLRGPQGTLYGRNTTAGVVNVISARPVDRFAASADVGYGNLGTRDATGMVNIPIGQGLGVRAAVNYQEQDAFYKVAVPVNVRINPFYKTLSGRLSFGGTVGDNFTFVIRGDYSQEKGAGTSGNTVTLDRFFPGPITPTVDPTYVKLNADQQRLLTVIPTVDNTSDNKNYGVMGEFTYDFGPVQLTYLGSYRKSKRDETGNKIRFGTLNNPGTFTWDNNQNSQEIRLAFGNGSAFHGQVGGYYFRERTSLELLGGLPLSSIFVPGATGIGVVIDPSITRSQAIFGQVTYDMTSDLHLTAGIRYTDDFKSRVGPVVVDFPSAASSFCGALRCVRSQNDAARTWKKTTWKLGVDYDAPGLGLIYASVSTGYHAGGFNDGCMTGAGIGCALSEDTLYYDPETLTAYEAGVKLHFGNSIRLNGAIFQYDYNDLQVSQVVVVPNPGTFVNNAARAKVNGVEVEFQAKLSDNDRFDVTYAYTNARFSDFRPDPINFPNVSFRGKQLDLSPKHTILAGYAHTFNLGNGGNIEASVRTKFNSEYFMQDLTNLSQFRQPGFSKSDATLTYNAADDRWYLQAFVKNIENEITLAGAATGLVQSATIMAPRTYGVRAGVKF